MAESSRESNIRLMLDNDASNQGEDARGSGPAGMPGTGVELELPYLHQLQLLAAQPLRRRLPRPSAFLLSFHLRGVEGVEGG